MNYQKIDLSKFYNVKGGILTAMVVDYPMDDTNSKWVRPAVIICPGGGYYYCSKREQEVVGFEFLSLGYNVFILEYLCMLDGATYPDQLLELACSVDYVRKNAKEFYVNPKEIFALGFSAGGHLVSSLSTDYSVAKKLYSGNIEPKITAAGLIYPVISDLYGHTATHENLFFEKEKTDLWKTRMDNFVCEKTVPTFLFSTFEDKNVPSMNALKYAQALAQMNISYELHIYKNGGHGMSVANKEINKITDGISRNKNWINDCAEFFRDFVKEKY